MRRTTLRLLALAVLLASCDTISGCSRVPAPSTVTAVTSRLAARIIPMETCPVTGTGYTAQLAPVIAAVLPFVIQLGASLVSNEIQKAQNNLNASYTAYGVIPSSTTPQCLVVVRGRFGAPAKALEAKGKITPTVLTAIGAAEQPTLYVEIKVTSDTAAAIRQFRPVFVQFNDTAAVNPGSDDEKTVNILLALAAKPIAAATPNTDQLTKSADIVVPFALGTLKRGTYLAGSAEVNAPVADLFAEQTRSVPIQVGKDRLPDTLDAYAIVTETSDPSLFDAALQKAVADKGFADALTKLADALLPKAPAK